MRHAIDWIACVALCAMPIPVHHKHIVKVETISPCAIVNQERLAIRTLNAVARMMCSPNVRRIRIVRRNWLAWIVVAKIHAVDQTFVTYNILAPCSIHLRFERLCADVRQTPLPTVKDVVSPSDTMRSVVAAMANVSIPINAFWAPVYLPAVSIVAVSMRNVCRSNIVANASALLVILATHSSNARQVCILNTIRNYLQIETY